MHNTNTNEFQQQSATQKHTKKKLCKNYQNNVTQYHNNAVTCDL